MINKFLLNLLGFNPDLTSRQPRVDSLSLVSRQSDLLTYVGRIAAILLLVLTIGVGNAWGTTYKLTQVSSVSASNKYVFVRNSRALINSISSNALQTTNTYSTSSLAGNETYVWTLETATNGFYIKSCKSSKYIKKGSGNTDITLDDTGGDWTITFSNGVALISNTSASNRFLGETSSGSGVYKGYATSNLSTYGHDFTVYRLDEESDCSSPATALSVGAAESTVYAGVKTQLSTSGGNGSTVTYTVTSDNSTYATIDGSNKFSATRAGTYTVRASQDDSGGTCGGTATVNITVRYQVKWSVNGNDAYSTGSPTAYIGTHDTKVTTLPTEPGSALCDGSKVFVGWTETQNYSNASTAPTDLFTDVAGSPTINANKTFYAVFATESNGSATYEIAGSSITGFDGGNGAYESGTYNTGDGFTIYCSNGYSTTQFRIAKSASITITSTIGDITQIVFTASGTDYKLNNNNISWTGTTGTYTNSGASTITLSNSNANIARITNIAITYGGTTYSNYETNCCTQLGTINGSISLTQGGNSVTIKDWSAVSNAGSYTIKMYKKNGASWDLVSGTAASASAGTQGTRTDITEAQRTSGVTFTGLVVESEYKFTVQAIAGSSAYCDGVETAVTSINSTDVSSTPFKFRYSICIDNGSGSDWTHHYIEPTGNTDEGSVTINLPAHIDSYQFKIYGTYTSVSSWGQTGSDKIPAATKWTLNGSNQVKLNTGAGGDYVITVDYSGTTNPGVTVTFPSADQGSGYKIYFDKSIIDGWGSTLKYRIGNNTHNQNQNFTLVTGTDNFYVTTTPGYNSMDAWQIANNVAWTPGNAQEYDANHGIYNYHHGDANNDITKATVYFDYTVDGDITMVPSSKKNTENSCDFWYVTKTDGMLTHTATITTPSHGTINIAYTDVNSAAQNKTATTAGLAHRTILTVTATPATGYQLSSLTVNGEAFTSGNEHILSADATIAATFTAKTYDVTLDPDGGSGSNQTVEATYDAAMPTTQKGGGAIVLPDKTGYTFGGYYSEKNGGGTQYYTSTGASARTWNIDGAITLYAKWTLKSHTLTWDWGGGACSGTAGTHYTAGGSVNYGTTINYPDESKMSKDGYDFTGWSTDVTSMPDENLTITAQWSIKHYTVTWLSNGSNYVTPVDYTHGAALALPAGTPSAPSGCSDKVFVGWTSDPEISTETSTKPTIISAGGAVNAVATYRAVFADRGGSGESNTYTRLETVSELYDGMKIVIVASQNSGAYLQQTASGITKYTSSIPKSTDEDITVTTSSLIWTLEAGTGVDAGKWRLLKDASNKLVADATPSYTASGSTFSIEDDSREFIIYNESCYGLEYYGATPQWKFYSPSKCNIDYGVYGLWLYGQLYDNYITLCSTCTTPSDVAASGITTDGATITWNGTSQENNGGSGTGFVVKYGTNSTRDANSNTINVAAGTNTADLTGLAQGTKYYVWVQSKCDDSWSTTPAEFTTLVSHTATFIGADGSTLQSSAIVEGESVTYSGSTPVSCDTGDGASTTFVGWATDTWDGKVAKGSIVPTFIDIAGGESLPAMSTSDVTYHAVFAKSSGTPLTNHAWTYTFTAQTYKANETQTLAGTDGGDAVNADWELLTYNQSSAAITNWGPYDSDRGSKIGKNDDDYVTYMYLSSESFDGTVTAVKISTSGNSGVSANVSATVGGTSFLNNSSSSVNISSSNTEYSFIGSKAISGEDKIMFIWEQESAKALYIKKIEIDYTTGGDVSYSNYMTTCSQCVTPNSVTADAITEAGATINWAGTSKTGTTGFTVLWGTDGTRANNSNSANVDADTKTYSITGLSAGTTYYVWVQSRCDGSWSDRISFTTKAIHTISFSADNGTISSGATIDIVNGETLTFPSVTSTTCGTFVGWTIGDYDNTAAPSPFYTAGAEMADITAPAAYKAVYRTASGAETLVTDNWTGAKTGVTTYATWTKTDASAATYQGYTAKNSTYSNCIQMKSADSNSGIITTASGGDAKKVTITWNSNTTSGRTVDVYGKKTAYTTAADLYSPSTQGTKIGSIEYGTSTELIIDGDYQYIGLRSNSGALYIDNIAIQWYGSPMHYMTSPTCNPMVGITESLSSFTYAYGAGPSASQSFTVSGSNLTNNVTVAAPANYEVCLTAAGTYSSSVSIPQVAGEIDNTTVYIRLKEGLNVGSYNGGVITVSSTGAIDATSAALTGSVTKAAATMAFTPDVYEATYEGSPVIVNFMLTLNGDGTVAYSRSPAAGSRAVNTDGENTFTALQAGIWTITATHTPGDNYTKAANATATVRVKCVDTYVDFIHNKAVLTYGSGTPVTDGKMEDWGSGYTVPYVADESEATSGSCQTTHFKFVGWVSEDEINIVEGTFKPGYTLISAGTAGKTASTKTYYAVWAKLED